MTRKRGQSPTPEEAAEARQKFLCHFAKNGNITLACRVAGISRNTFYRWQEQDAEFGLRYQQASKEADEALEGEAWRRAVRGVKRHKPHFYMGATCGEEIITEYSDTLLIFLMKGRMPEKYRENIDVKTEHVFVGEHITDDERRAIAARILQS